MQRALIISSLSQQLAQAELGNKAAQTQLAAAQKQIEALKEKCGDACKDVTAK